MVSALNERSVVMGTDPGVELLVDPVVHSVSAAEQTLEMMLRVQRRWLGYLQ